MKMIMSMMIIILSIFMFFLNNPLSMGLIILILTLLLSMILGSLITTYWFSYILFLVFLGGLLVMFIYVSTIASNEMFQLQMKTLSYMMTIMIMMMTTTIMLSNLKFLNLSFNLEMMNTNNNYLFFNNENKLNLTKLYNTQTYPLMTMMVIQLFITLLSAVKISNADYGPLRT